MKYFIYQTFNYVLFLFSLSLFSQGYQIEITDFTTKVSLASDNFTNSIGNIIGSPYVEEKFQSVRLKNYENKVYSGRFNAFNNEMEIIVDAGKRPVALDITNNDHEVYFIAQDKTYKSFTYTTDRGVSKRGFLVVVSEDNGVGLLKGETVKFYDFVKANSSYVQDKPAKFERNADNYYVKFKDGSISYLPTKSKDILKAFPQNEKEIDNFIKKNKLKTKDEEDLIKVADFIGSL